jgi:hypothetical protein
MDPGWGVGLLGFAGLTLVFAGVRTNACSIASLFEQAVRLKSWLRGAWLPDECQLITGASATLLGIAVPMRGLDVGVDVESAELQRHYMVNHCALGMWMLMALRYPLSAYTAYPCITSEYILTVDVLVVTSAFGRLEPC